MTREGDRVLRHGLPALPSLFSPVRLREGGDALARAVALAPTRGAGTLCWVAAASRVEAAVVLEPEQSLAEARAALHAVSLALVDTLVSFGPPQTEFALRWPGSLVVNRGLVGRARLAWPETGAEHAVPAWLVAGIEARFAFPAGHEPGLEPGRTCLREEGFDDVTTAELTAGWARHLMATFADWQQDGFAPLADRMLARLERAPWMGAARRGLDPGTGDLILEQADGARVRHALREALAA